VWGVKFRDVADLLLSSLILDLCLLSLHHQPLEAIVHYSIGLPLLRLLHAGPPHLRFLRFQSPPHPVLSRRPPITMNRSHVQRPVLAGHDPKITLLLAPLFKHLVREHFAVQVVLAVSDQRLVLDSDDLFNGI